MNWERLYHQIVIERDELKEQVRQLNDLLGYMRPGPTFVHLTNTECRLFGALMQREVLTKEACLHALYYDRGGDEPEQKIVDVFVCKLRKKLTPHGVVIGTIWGRGYFLSEETKARVRQLDAGYQESAAA